MLAEAAGRDPEEVEKLYQDDVVSPEDLEHAEDDLKNIYELRVAGHSRLAATMCHDLIEWLKIKERKAPKSSYRNKLLRLHGKALYEYRIAFHESAPQDQIEPSTSKIYKELQSIAEALDDDEFYGLADLSMGDTYYMLRDSREALRWLNTGLEFVRNLNDQFGGRRSKILALAYLGEKREFEIEVAKTLYLIEGGHWTRPEQVVELVEGIGRGQGILNIEQGYDTLDRALTYEGSQSRLRQIQIARSRLEIVRYVAPSDINLLLAEGEKALQMAREGYPRHADQIEQFMRDLPT